jgi:hypothetical protein
VWFAAKQYAKLAQLMLLAESLANHVYPKELRPAFRLSQVDQATLSQLSASFLAY